MTDTATNLANAVRGLLHEWDKFTRYGSPIAKAANERVRFARDTLAEYESSPPSPSGLREALRPFAELADEIEQCCKQYPADDPCHSPDNWMKGCQWEDLVAARAALASPDDGLRTAHRAGLESVARYCARDVRPPSVDDQQYRELIANIVEALEFASGQRASPDDGWVKVDEEHPLPHDLQVGDELAFKIELLNPEQQHGSRYWLYRIAHKYRPYADDVSAYRRRPAAEQGG